MQKNHDHQSETTGCHHLPALFARRTNEPAVESLLIRGWFISACCAPAKGAITHFGTWQQQGYEKLPLGAQFFERLFSSLAADAQLCHTSCELWLEKACSVYFIASSMHTYRPFMVSIINNWNQHLFFTLQEGKATTLNPTDIAWRSADEWRRLRWACWCNFSLYNSWADKLYQSPSESDEQLPFWCLFTPLCTLEGAGSKEFVTLFSA